ncbi:hypothetical protein [Cerasicoccus maritimus]|uniref:hypothetical protein n=1 Tax=Cerasicoccus maritimus TaxID=490089 RepID=UPI00285276FD|nr:hypothetical protein [Cerasicoccus maritimus]
MTYLEFKTRVQSELQQAPGGLTWRELKAAADLPYARACPEWTRCLEADIALDRTERRGRAQVWRIIPR